LLEAIPILLKLMKDTHTGARDWATTSLAATGFDTPEIRAALIERATTDPDAMTRGEALHGLTRRGDGRAVELLIAELSAGETHLFEDAASTWLGIDLLESKVSAEALLEGLRASRH
jgi:HEAT repeat protein